MLPHKKSESNSPLKIVLQLAGLASLMFITYIVVSPIFAFRHYTHTFKNEFNTNISQVRQYMHDYTSYPQTLASIKAVTLLDSTKLQLRYKIHTHSGHFFTVQQSILSDTSHTLSIENTSFGYSAIWQYTYSESDKDMCMLNIKEDAKVANYTTRLLLNVIGRDVFLREEIRRLKKMCNEEE